MGKTTENAQIISCYLQEKRKKSKTRSLKEEAMAADEAGRELVSMSDSRGSKTLKEMINKVKKMTKVNREEMIHTLDGIRGGMADSKDA
jgi:hypothetical protein